MCHFIDLLSPRPEGLRTPAHQVLPVQGGTWDGGPLMEHTQTSQDPRGETVAPRKVPAFQSREASITMDSGAMFTEVEPVEPITIQTPESDPHSQKEQSKGPVCLQMHI